MATRGTVGKANKGEVLGARVSKDLKGKSMSKFSREVKQEPLLECL